MDFMAGLYLTTHLVQWDRLADCTQAPLPCEHEQPKHHLNELLATVKHFLFGICTFPSTSRLWEPWMLLVLLCQPALVNACSRRKPSSLCKVPYSMLGLSTAGILQYFMLLFDGKVLQMAHFFLGNGHVLCLISQMSSKRCYVVVSDLVWKSPYSIINLLSLLLPHCIVLVLIFNIIFMHF